MKSLCKWLLVVSAFAHLRAGFVHVWAIGEIENSPALVVATVERVARKEAVPQAQWRSSAPEQYFEAILRVRRVFSRARIGVGGTVTVRYIGAGESHPVVMNGFPMWPPMEKGVMALFPLAPGKDGKWLPVADQGWNLIVPAISDFRGSGKVQSGRSFIIAELANTLANGDAASRYGASLYLREANRWPDGFRPELERAVGANDNRWLEVACALLASMGTPRPTIGELMGQPDSEDPRNRYREIGWVLAKGVKRGYPDRLIRALLRNQTAYEWGAANSLREFKDSPIVIQAVRAALVHDPRASIHLARQLIQAGQRAFLREALNAAVKLASSPEGVSISTLQAASWLLREEGTDEQFNVIPATLRRLKFENEEDYRKLYGSVSYSVSKRELRTAAVLIDDRRFGFGRLRYCDVAAAAVERFSGESFGMNQSMTLDERDRRVAIVAAWLRTHRDAL